MASNVKFAIKQPNRIRNESLAGHRVKQGDNTVEYGKNGYVSSIVHDGGKSATSTAKTTHANDSATHQAMYQAAQNNDWDKVGSLSHGLISADGDFSAGNAYIRELQDEFKYDANEYYGKKYDDAFGKGAWDGGTGTGTPGGSQRTGTDGYNSFEEFLNGMGYDSYEEETKKAIQAAVQNAVNGYNQQIQNTNDDTAELARQAYISKMLGEKNLEQQLAAGGYAGGMADSQRIALQANYESNLNELEKQRAATVKELETAITNARLTGDMQTAQELSGYLQQIQSQWNGYLQNQQAMANQNYWNQQSLNNENYWNQQNLDNNNYWKQQSLNADNQGTARNWALTLIQNGTMPDDETLMAAGLSKAQAQTLMGAGRTAATNAGRLANYNNGSLSIDQVKQMQNYLGVTPDGLWGSESRGKANGMSADQAWAAYQKALANQPSQTYAEVDSVVGQTMQASGKQAALAALWDAYKRGVLDASEYNTLHKKYNYGIGG